VKQTALIVGVSGIAGSGLADLLLASGDWTIYGLARQPSPSTSRTPTPSTSPERHPSDPRLPHHLAPPAHRSRKHPRQRRHGAQRPRRRLGRRTVQHVALVTGLKHYLGPFEPTAKESSPPRPSAKSSPASTSKTSTTRRKTKSSPPPPATTTPGASIAPTPSSATRRQRHEHGHHPRRLRQHLQRTRPAHALPRLLRAVEQPHRHDRRAHPRQATPLGSDHPRRSQPGLQRNVNGDIFRWSWMWKRSPPGSTSTRRGAKAKASPSRPS
jgi:hypothetical protein